MSSLAQRITALQDQIREKQDALSAHLQNLDDNNVSDADLETSSRFNADIERLQKTHQGAGGRRLTFDGLLDQFLPGKYDPPSFALQLAHKDVALANALGRARHTDANVQSGLCRDD